MADFHAQTEVARWRTVMGKLKPPLFIAFIVYLVMLLGAFIFDGDGSALGFVQSLRRIDFSGLGYLQFWAVFIALFGAFFPVLFAREWYERPVIDQAEDINRDISKKTIVDGEVYVRGVRLHEGPPEALLESTLETCRCAGEEILRLAPFSSGISSWEDYRCYGLEEFTVNKKGKLVKKSQLDLTAKTTKKKAKPLRAGLVSVLVHKVKDAISNF